MRCAAALFCLVEDGAGQGWGCPCSLAALDVRALPGDGPAGLCCAGIPGISLGSLGSHWDHTGFHLQAVAPWPLEQLALISSP